MIRHHELLIDGEWVPSAGDGVIGIENPVTEEVFATIPRGAVWDVDRAAEAAMRAFPDWSRSSPGERAEILNALADVVERRAEEITRTIVTEIGEPLSIATRHQTLSTVAHLRDTTVQPAAIAAPTFIAIISNGTFHGVMAPTTPTGAR